MSWWLVYTIAAGSWVAINAVIIMLQRRPAVSTIAWLMVLVFLPIVGLVIYRLIGPLRLERRKRRREPSKRRRRGPSRARRARRRLRAPPARDGRDRARRLAAAARRTVAIYLDGASTYEAILEAVARREAPRPPRVLHLGARHDRHPAARRADRAREGGRQGAHDRRRHRLEQTVEASSSSRCARRASRSRGSTRCGCCKLRLRRPTSAPTARSSSCDGRVGFTGGMNITDSHSAAVGPDYWRDTHLRIDRRRGVAAAAPVPRGLVLRGRRACARSTPSTFPPPHDDGEHLVQIVGSGPDSDAFAIHKVLFTAINQSTDAAAG